MYTNFNSLQCLIITFAVFVFTKVSFGDNVIQSMFSGMLCVPFVSIATNLPHSCNLSIRLAVSCSEGSPPVITTCLAGYLQLRRLSRIHSFLVHADGSCHRKDTSLHPEKRMNTAGVPVKKPSPCNE